MAECGAKVAVFDLLENETAEFACELTQKYGVQALGVACDVADPLSVDLAVQKTVQELGPIHILHNNAQEKTDDPATALAPFEEYSLAEWRRVMSVNIDGMFLMAQAVGKEMIRQQTGGSIIQTCSIYGIMAPDHRIYEGSFFRGYKIGCPASYSASKAAVDGLTKYLATYWAKYGIRVNTLTPGGVESGQNELFKSRYGERIPLGRMAKAEEMTGALIYLASDASQYVTGHNLVVDGGLHAW